MDGFMVDVELAGLAGDIALAAGEAGDGPAILLVHGWLQSRRIWHRVIPFLTDEYTVITVDLPGFGQSPALPEGAIDIPVYVDTVDGLISCLNQTHEEIAAIVGNSLGALLVLAAPVVRRTDVTSLVLSGCPVEGLPKILEHVHVEGLIPALIQGLGRLPDPMTLSVVRIFSGLTFHRKAAVDRSVVRGITESDPRTAERLYEEMLYARDWLNVNEGDVSPAVAAVRGEHDRIVDAESAIRFVRETGSVYREISDVGHTPMLEDPSRYAEILRTLARESPGAPENVSRA